MFGGGDERRKRVEHRQRNAHGTEGVERGSNESGRWPAVKRMRAAKQKTNQKNAKATKRRVGNKEGQKAKKVNVNE